MLTTSSPKLSLHYVALEPKSSCCEDLTKLQTPVGALRCERTEKWPLAYAAGDLPVLFPKFWPCQNLELAQQQTQKLINNKTKVDISLKFF